jgi:hypothetical protein
MKNYVKVFNGHEVPEGATHYDIKFRLPYYSIISGQETKFYRDDLSKWLISQNGNDWHNEKLTELPEAKWKPVVGENCRHIYSINSEAEKVFIVGIDKKGNYVFQNNDSDCYYSDPIHFFIPLKTAKELEREAFTRKALKLRAAFDNDESYVDALFDKGARFTAPKEVK